MSFCVLGTGSYVPPKVVTNDDLASFLVTSDEWIRERTGIRERHVCVEESACDLAYQAALAALDQSGVKAEELDMILCDYQLGFCHPFHVLCDTKETGRLLPGDGYQCGLLRIFVLAGYCGGLFRPGPGGKDAGDRRGADQPPAGLG